MSDCEEVDKRTHSSYENKLSDWMAIEAIVRQKDKEITAASIAKLSGDFDRCVQFDLNNNLIFLIHRKIVRWLISITYDDLANNINIFSTVSRFSFNIVAFY